jgi:putative transposase
LKLKVFQGGFDPGHVNDSPIPRSTLAPWKSRPPKPVVSLLTDTQTAIEVQRDALLIETQRLKTKLAAMRSLVMLLTILRLSRFTFEGVMDNFSPKLLAYRVCENYEPTATATLLEEAASCLPPNANDPLQSPPAVSLYCDGVVENFDDAVDQRLSRFQMQRVQAQIDVQFSNSMIEAFWRSTKHNRLFQQKLDSVSALRQWTDFYVRQPNEVMPHSAFKGQTPDETFFGTGKSVEADVSQARVASRQARIEFNSMRSCAACSQKEPELHKIQLDKP